MTATNNQLLQFPLKAGEADQAIAMFFEAHCHFVGGAAASKNDLLWLVQLYVCGVFDKKCPDEIEFHFLEVERPGTDPSQYYLGGPASMVKFIGEMFGAACIRLDYEVWRSVASTGTRSIVLRATPKLVVLGGRTVVWAAS